MRPNLPAGVEGMGGGGKERGWKEATKSSVTKDLSSRVVSTQLSASDMDAFNYP